MTTFADGLFQYGGAPVGRNTDYAGWWGEDVFFVDYKNGARGVLGKKINEPTKDLADALTNSTSGATIFMRPHTDPHVHGRDPREITPYSGTALNWTIPYAKHHISIIGTGKLSKGGLANETLLRGYRGATTPTLRIAGAYATVENLCFRYNLPVTAQNNACIEIDNKTETTDAGYAATINNCTFREYSYASNGHGAIVVESSRWNAVLNCTFYDAWCGIWLGSSKNTVIGFAAEGNTFIADASDVGNDIRIPDAQHMDIKKNSFQHAQPSAGAPNLYVYCAGTATGTFEDNFLATTEATIGIACGLSNIVDVANKCGADTTWMTNA